MDDRPANFAEPLESRCLLSSTAAGMRLAAHALPNLSIEEIYMVDDAGHRLTNPPAGTHVSIRATFTVTNLPPGKSFFLVWSETSDGQASWNDVSLVKVYPQNWRDGKTYDQFVDTWTVTPGNTKITVVLESPNQVQESTEHDNRLILTVDGGQWVPTVFPNLPKLHSLPGASSAIYLDFDGNLGDHATPVYDTDVNPSVLSAKELSAIRDAWSIVSEDYAPFNVDVTTVEPTDGQYRQWVRVCIGGLPDWSDQGFGFGGSPYLDADHPGYPAYARSMKDPVMLGDIISHEAGHSFGLVHQASYNSAGRLISEYNDGGADWGPIMGSSGGVHATWYNGPTPAGPQVLQDDMAILGKSLGYRPDDYGNSLADATPLPKGKKTVTHGLIGKNHDIDVFSLHHSGGGLSIKLTTAKYPNLDAVLILRDAAGKVIAISNPRNSFGASLLQTLPPGKYFLCVKSGGAYGSVGQYILNTTTTNKFF
jgi:hypothetical protein